MIAAIEDNDPVVMLEHRWLYNIKDTVPEHMYRVPLNKAQVVRGYRCHHSIHFPHDAGSPPCCRHTRQRGHFH